MTEDATGDTYVYDAWNRLVTGSQFTDGEKYEYDALGQRVADDYTHIETRSDFYYSADGHNIEDHLCNTITDQYVWVLDGPNELILRDQTETTNTGGYNLGEASSGLGLRYYVEQDANGNVTAIVAPDGTVQAHFIYDPYGAVQGINAGYTATAGLGDWAYFFQGGRRDPTTGFYRFGEIDARDYNPFTETWNEADMAGYVNGLDLYQPFLSNPLVYNDPTGMNAVMSGVSAAAGGILGGAAAFANKAGSTPTTQPATQPSEPTPQDIVNGLTDR